MIKAIQVGAILALALHSVSCSGPAAVTPVPGDMVRDSEQYKTVVAFDLRDDSKPSCALFLRETASLETAPRQQTVLLPFPTEAMSNSSDLFATWGSVGGCCSLVSYIHMPEKSGTFSVALRPLFSAQPQDVSDLPGQIYLLRFGQERRFIYRYGLPTGANDLRKLSSVSGVSVPDAVAVARPSDAKGLEVKSGMTEYPARKAWNGVASFYVSDGGTDHLEVRYELALTSAQEVALKFLVELISALAPPLGVLWFLDLKDKGKKRWKIVVLVALIIFELTALAMIGYLAWRDRTTKSLEAVLSSSAAIAGLVVSMIVALFKRGAGGSASLEF